MQRHEGFSSGCKAEFCRFPEKGVAIICLSNRADSNPTWLARQVADLILAATLSLFPPSALASLLRRLPALNCQRAG